MVTMPLAGAGPVDLPPELIDISPEQLAELEAAFAAVESMEEGDDCPICVALRRQQRGG